MEAKRTPRILVIGGGEHGKGTLVEAMLRDEYGEDLVVVTPEEAIQQGLGPADFDIAPTMRIEPLRAMDLLVHPASVKCGKAKRRERRAAERKSQRKRGN